MTVSVAPAEDEDTIDAIRERMILASWGASVRFHSLQI